MVAVLSTLLLTAGSAALARSIVRNPDWRNSTDFGVYLLASRALASGDDPYASAPFPVSQIGSVEVRDAYVYPPALAEFLVLLLAMGDAFARSVWLVISIASLAGATVLLSRKFGHRLAWKWVVLILSAASVSGIVRLDLYHGETNLLLLLLLTLGLWLLSGRHVTFAGLAWGVATTIKPFLAVLIVYLLWKRAWRAAIATVCTSLTVLVVSFAITWPRTVATLLGWLRAAGYEASTTFSGRPDNVSIHGLVLRLFDPNPYTRTWIDSAVAGHAVEVLVLAGVAATFIAAAEIAPGRRPGTSRCSALLLSVIDRPRTQAQ